MEHFVEIAIHNDGTETVMQFVTTNIPLQFPTDDSLFYVDKIATNTWIKVSQITPYFSTDLITIADAPYCLKQIIMRGAYPIVRVLTRTNNGAQEIYLATCDNKLCGQHNPGKHRMIKFVRENSNQVIGIFNNKIYSISKHNVFVCNGTKIKYIWVLKYKLTLIELDTN